MTTIGTTSRPAYVYDADTDTWVPIGVGPHTHDEYVDKVLFDNKGDILVGTGEDTLGKLAVGEDGQFLVVDLDEPTGLTWRTLNANIDVSATAPTGPTSGSVWFNSSEGTAYIYYDSYWVPLSPAQVGPQGDAGVFVSATAPSNTDVIWVDTDEDPDVPVPAGGSAGQILQKTSNNDYQTAWVNTPSDNFIINGGFDIWQRGTSFTNPSATSYTADRTRTNYNGTGSTRIYSRQNFTPSLFSSFGYEPEYFYRFSQTVAGSGATFNNFYENLIEDSRTLSGQTVTISFWGKADASRTIAPNFFRHYGSGGSSPETVVSATPVGLTTQWARYSRTVTIPTVAGKTIGDGSYIALILGAPANITQTIDIWGVQVELGSIATPFKRNAPSIQAELAACQRYFVRITTGSIYGLIAPGVSQAGNSVRCGFVLPVPTRALVSSTLVWGGALQFESGAGAANVSGMTIDVNTISRQLVGVVLTLAAAFSSNQPGYLMGSNNATSFVDFSAEL